MDRYGITCIKRFIFVWNLLIWLVGIGVLVFSMWLWFDNGESSAPEKLTEHLSILAELDYYYAAVWLLIAAGVMLLITGVFGWLGAYRESHCMLLTYAVSIAVVCLCHFLSAALVYSSRYQILSNLSTGIESTIQNDYGQGADKIQLTETVDYLQRHYNCCGSTEFEDWASSRWRVSYLDEVVPASCCFGSSGADTFCPTYSYITGGRNPYLHLTGCGRKLQQRFTDYITGITIGGIVCGMSELLACITTVVLVKKLQAEDKSIYR